MKEGASAERASARQKEALTRLTRLTNRRPQTSIHLDRALDERRLEELVALVTEVAAESGEAAGKALLDCVRIIPSATSLEKIVTRCGLAGRVSPLALREVALAASRRLLELRALTNSGKDHSDEIEAAKLITDIASRLNDLGRWREAFEANEEAISRFRQVPAKHRSARYWKQYGISLGNQSIRFGRQNRWVEALSVAQEAVQVQRRQVEMDASPENLHQLASRLDNLGIVFSELDRGAEGLAAGKEAVKIRRRNLLLHPQGWTSLAASLSNLGGRFFDLDRAEEARSHLEESVEIRRDLCHKESDNLNHLPDLARSLHNLGIVYKGIGHFNEAIRVTAEAVELRRRLHSGRPSTFGFDLARSLHRLGLYRERVDETESAYGHFSEAIDLRRQWAESQPETMGSLLADSLSGRARARETLKELEASIRDSLEAIEIRAPFVATRPKVELENFERDIRRTLRLLAREKRWSDMIKIVDLSLHTLEMISEESAELASDFIMWLGRSRVTWTRQITCKG